MQTNLIDKNSNPTHSFGEIKYKPGGKVKSALGRISAGIMLPIAVLPIAGLFLGIGSAIYNEAHNSGVLKTLGSIIKFPGDVVFSNLAVLFAIGIAIAFTNDAGPAGFAALIGWLIFNAIQAAITKTTTYNFYQPPAGGDQTFSVIHFLFYKFVMTPDGKATGYLDSTLQQIQSFSSTFGGKFNDVFYNGLFGANCGITSMQTSVFGGIIVGGATAILYNRYHTIQLPTIFGFFNGVRFVPIITFVTCAMLGLIISAIWPLIAFLLFLFGGVITQMPMSFNAFIETFVQRALVPFGLHHVWYASFWYTSAGGQFDLTQTAGIYINNTWYTIREIGGQASITWYQLANDFGAKLGEQQNAISGDQKIWSFLFSSLCGNKVELYKSDGSLFGTHILTFSDFSQKSWTPWSHAHSAPINNDQLGIKPIQGVNVAQYFGWYPMMMFGLPAAGFAMVVCTKPGEQRKQTISIILSAAITSFLTGITEPLEFTFVFIAPWLFWGVHTTFTALGSWIILLLGSHVGATFSCGVLDFTFYGIIPDVSHAGANCWNVLIVGAAIAFIYFFTFTYCIRKYNLQTPGRGKTTKLFTKADYKKKIEQEKSSESVTNTDTEVTVGAKKVPLNPLVEQIIKLYGGKENIVTVAACITKLRIDVKDISIPLSNKNELIDLAMSTGNVAGSNVTPVGQQVQLMMGQIAGRIRDAVKEKLKN